VVYVQDPITDPGKNSKHGRLALVQTTPGTFHTVENVDTSAASDDRLATVFENGEIKKEYDFDSIRQRADLPTLDS
jgi:nicotinamide phosphoribosyltransferase